MAPIKFEEHIREQLEKRKIKPTEGSWEKLNARLDNSDTKRKSKWWMGIAAAVVVCLIVSMFFISQQKQTGSPMVENPVEEAVPKPQRFEKSASLASEETKSEDISDKKKEVTTKRSPENQKNKNQNVVASAEANEPGSENEEKISPTKSVISPVVEISPIPLKENELKIEKNILDNKIEELVAKVKKQKNAGEIVTDEEVNALLAEAAKDLGQERKFYSHGRVDADELLADVEADIDQSFRKEIFQLLKEGFVKATTAVATRNY
ncbi:hypothetical protein C7S20_01870 [Christiangramia fulva]|uniref:Uncharacterized protein n=1 Tax=Christiangramia fulva TaxID=2126553 RepID=A0A2R3Z1F9_9FLAO|nr:hypothetical protein [Christiangramia fulva]AVR44107.1 hypothetical protein C7S20_01870 [Christiangramia fulva]